MIKKIYMRNTDRNIQKEEYVPTCGSTEWFGQQENTCGDFWKIEAGDVAQWF